MQNVFIYVLAYIRVELVGWWYDSGLGFKGVPTPGDGK